MKKSVSGIILQQELYDHYGTQFINKMDIIDIDLRRFHLLAIALLIFGIR